MDLEIIVSKIKKIISTQAQIAGRVSKNGHDISDIKSEIEDVEDLSEEAHERVDDIELDIVGFSKDLEYIQKTIKSIYTRFTITKIIATSVAVITVGLGMVTAFLAVLKNLGVF